MDRLIFKHLFLILASLAIILTRSRCQAEHTANDEFLGMSAELQSVNSYLNEIDPLSATHVVRSLEEARLILNTLGDDVVRTGVEAGSADDSIRCLLGNNPDTLRTILDSLIVAAKSCSQESVNFLDLVVSQTFDGQFLHSYSQELINVCQANQADLIAGIAEKSLSKSNSAVYELMADLAQINMVRRQKSAVSRGDVFISDEQKSADASVVTKSLKELRLDTDSQIVSFATSIRDYYAREFPTESGVTPAQRRKRLRNFLTDSLIGPCEDLTKRWREAINYQGSVKLYPAESRSKKVSAAIEARRKNDASLDRSVEMVRICLNIQKNSNSIISKVER